MNISTEQLFDHARTHNGFHPEPIPEATLRQLYELMKWGPTSANCGPARIVFVASPAAKEKLLACVSPGNFEKTRQAFAGTSVKSNFICNLGRGDASKLMPRSPRLAFEEACSIA